MWENKTRTPNFELSPYVSVKNTVSYAGYESIVEQLKKSIATGRKTVVVFDYYHGVDEKKLYDELISKLDADLWVDTDEAKLPESVIEPKFHEFITDDRVNGVMCTCKIEEFFDEEKIAELRARIERAEGLVVVYGVAATVICNGDILVLAHVGVQEIKYRYARGLDNWGAGNYKEENLRKDKRYTFLEGRVQEWHRRPLLERMDYIIDDFNVDRPVMICKRTFDRITEDLVSRPFQTVPFFNPGVWGGHWCQQVLGAGRDLVNTAWGITGMIDWQDIQVNVGGNIFRVRGKDLEYARPLELLGGQVFFLYGYRCPVTMDFLDTMEGQNLSLQCHPTVSYCQEVFNAPTGHYESYYMMDTSETSSVYLGVKNGTKLDELVEAFEEGQRTGKFDDTKWINNWPMKKHDHIFIPSGTIHASGKNTVVLELNSVGYTTFKLWDWDRVDLDGNPRPIDIGHGAKNIQVRYDTDFTRDKLISKKREIARGDGWRKEHSGTMEYEPLHVERYWFSKALHFESNETVKLLCLVEGEEAIIESPNRSFEPFVIHYAECTYIPSNVGQFYVKPYGKSEGQEIALVECYQDLGSQQYKG